MKLFNRKQTKTSMPQKSLDDFKKSAAAINSAEAINSITGGTMSGCHTGGGGIKLAAF